MSGYITRSGPTLLPLRYISVPTPYPDPVPRQDIQLDPDQQPQTRLQDHDPFSTAICFQASLLYVCAVTDLVPAMASSRNYRDREVHRWNGCTCDASSSDACQLADRGDVRRWNVDTDVASLDSGGPGKVNRIRIGSFNCGVAYSTLTGKRCYITLNKVQQIISTCVTDFGLHIMNMCELGGHRQGLLEAGITPTDMRIFDHTVIGAGTPTASITGNYLTSYGFDADISQPEIKETRDRQVHELIHGTGPELVVHFFETIGGVRIVQGNLYIRTTNRTLVTILTRQRLVRDAIEWLESDAHKQFGRTDSATQPVVLVLLGDCQLTLTLAEQGIQQCQPDDMTEEDYRAPWHVHATHAGLGGDLVFVKGAHAQSFDLPFGRSWPDRGTRNDEHDAIYVELKVHVLNQQTTGHHVTADAISMPSRKSRRHRQSW